MKKVLLSLGLIWIFWGLLSITSASSTSCKEVEFANGVTACVNIEDAGTNRRSMTTDVDGGSTSNLRCDIMTPDSALRSISACNGEFTYSQEKAGRIKLWIRYTNTAPTDWEGKPYTDSERTYPQWVYDFDNEERSDDDLTSTDDDNDTADNFYITASPSSPDEDESVDITVKARDGTSTNEDYRNTARFKVQRRDNSSDEWISASSSLYELDRTSYTFTSSDDGIHEFSNLVTFTNDSYDYRLVVYDDDDIEGYKVFDFGNGYDSDYDSNDTDNFYLISSTSSPSTSQYVDVTVRARDGSSTDDTYRGTIKFKVQRESWSSRITASSSYYTLNKTSYTFTSSDDGIHEFSDLIKFTNDNYDYRLVIYDSSDSSIEGYKTFYVNTDEDDESNYDTDNFYLSTDDTTPNVNQQVDLTIKARDGTSTDTAYRGTVQFEVYYKADGSSTWTKTTSLSYYEMKYPYEDNGYTFNSSNNGLITITDFIRFRKDNYSYKVLVYDEDDESIDSEKIFTLGDVDDDSDSNYDTDNFYLSTDDTTPSTYQYVDLTVKSRDGTSTDTAYRGTVQFEVYYKASSSSTRTRTTSSSYYTMNSSYDDGYTFTSSNAGQKTFSDLIQFKKNNYSYKVLVYDEDDESIDSEKIFTVGSVDDDSDSDVDGFTSSELNTVEDMYDARDNMIYTMESSYSSLRNNSRRQTMSDDLKDAMYEIIHDNSNKTYDNFDDFYDAFLDRYRYTVSVR